MNKYETIYIVKPDVTEEDLQAIVLKFKAIIEANGEIETIDDWGKRKLAYLIDDIGEGFYVYMKYKADRAVPKELERVFGITEDILRSMTIKLD